MNCLSNDRLAKIDSCKLHAVSVTNTVACTVNSYLDSHAANNHSVSDDIQSDYRQFQSRPLATEMVGSRKQGVGMVAISESFLC